MNSVSDLSIERLIAGHKRRVEQLRLDWIEARNKGFKGKMKFIEKLGKSHKKEIENLQTKLKG